VLVHVEIIYFTKKYAIKMYSKLFMKSYIQSEEKILLTKKIINFSIFNFLTNECTKNSINNIDCRLYTCTTKTNVIQVIAIYNFYLKTKFCFRLKEM